MAQGAVQHPQAVDRVLVGCQAQPVEVVAQKPKALHVLLHGAGNGLDLGKGLGIPQAYCPGQRRCKGGFAVFPGQHQESFLEPPNQRAGEVESADVVDNEHLKRLQHQRLSPEGPAVQVLALLVAEESLYGHDHEFRHIRPELPAGILPVF